ncbi:Jacalin-related lectin 19 [Ananas comosus]|uniref:Jacalin-related lectin 19 n=1 Tax=Ananas comosus TaxID=4615 RepID=A0A199VE84_ANACO|nr:Jacalin-related lectin 19 [Ananas comosus]
MNIGQTGETFIRIGPQGDDRGDEWDDGCFDGVREILIWHGDKINAIQFVYDRDGTLVLSDKHGGNGTNFDHNIGRTGETFIKIGPRGGVHGCEWDDGYFDGVREILIWHGEEINAIQFVYNCNGTLVLSEKHGVDGTNFDHVSHP